MKRRRRRSSFTKPTPHRKWIALGVGAIAVIGSMAYFIHQAEKLAPEAHDVRIELPLPH